MDREEDKSEENKSVRRSSRSKTLSLKAELNLQIGVNKKLATAAAGGASIPTLECISEQCSVGGCGLPMDNKYEDLYSLLPGRRVQIEILLMLLIGGHPPPCLYVYGTSGSGKSLTLNTVLSRLKLQHIVINSRECYSPGILYKDILNQLSGISPDETNNYVGYSRCDNFPTFIHLFGKLVHQKLLQPYFIVLDHAECLKDLLGSLFLQTFIRLSDLSDCQVCVILVSHIISKKLLNENETRTHLSITFPQYTKGETLDIMLLDCPSDQPHHFYQTFVHHIWNVFQNVCRDLSELRHLSSVLFPKYMEPVEKGEIDIHESRKLWKHIEPFFKSVMSRVYLHEISISTQWEELSSSPSTILELPVYSKYILISSFLASYNPAKTDRHFFSKLKQSKVRKSKKPKRMEENEVYLGPKSFPLDRMMAIFYTIIGEAIFPIAALHFQVSTLVSLQLIAQITKHDILDLPKFKCLINLDSIHQVAKSIGFDLFHYLHDFNV